jgi:hypothetical protein
MLSEMYSPDEPPIWRRYRLVSYKLYVSFRPSVTENKGQLLIPCIRLVATIGSKSGARKVTRKDIQGVDVQRACGKILEPGAPIALRLQGNLLYGISRVHNQQCTYLVADARKIQDQIKLSFRNILSNQLDFDEGEAR